MLPKCKRVLRARRLDREATAIRFRNYYRCAQCGRQWTDIWSAQCDDDCPWCGARHMSPYKSEDVEEGDDE
jgi:DNA-directed RNA polymerase subunit RPC12/RpoP